MVRPAGFEPAAFSSHKLITNIGHGAALDDLKPDVIAEGKLYLHNLSDLCSRYKFHPLASAALPGGEEVTGHLSHLFSKFGAPLFCKRDNGGNLNHLSVNEVLAQAYVIPINSPPCTAPYNGAIEHTQVSSKIIFVIGNGKQIPSTS